MNTLDLIRKLYDEGVDPAELEQGLGEESLAELKRFVEAKEAMDSLPRRRPSEASLAAIRAAAQGSKPRERGRMTLILNPRFFQRLAAAAAIVAAVGLGYLTMQSLGPGLQTEPTVASEEVGQEQPAPNELASALRDLEEAKAPATGEAAPKSEAVLTDKTDLDEIAEVETPELAVEAEGDAAAEPARRSLNDSIRARSAARLDVAGTGGRAIMAGSSTGDDALGVSWEDKQDFQKFYWQVQALEQRSPDDEWEEAVPLEGSFRAVTPAGRDRSAEQANEK